MQSYNFEPIHRACWYGDLKQLRKILKRTDPNLRDNNDFKRTPLHIAASRKNLPVAKILLENKAEIDLEDAYGRTALHIACAKGDLRMATLLLRHHAKIEAIDNFGRTPLLEAGRNGHIKVLKFLLEKGATIYTFDGKGRTVFHLMARKGQTKTFKSMVEHADDSQPYGYDSLMLLFGDVKHRSPSQVAMRHKYYYRGPSKPIAIAQMVRGHFIDAALKGNQRFVKLFFSAYALLDIVKVLTKKIPVDIRELGKKHTRLGDSVYTILHLLASDSHAEVLQPILEESVARGVNLNVKDSEDKWFPLTRALHNGQFKAAGLFIKSGATLQARLKHRNWTLLHDAVYQDSLAGVRMLLTAGIDPNAVDGDRWTSLHLASYYGRERIVRELLRDDRVKVNQGDNFGRTALKHAEARHHDKVADMLRGGNTNLLDNIADDFPHASVTTSMGTV